MSLTYTLTDLIQTATAEYTHYTDWYDVPLFVGDAIGVFQSGESVVVKEGEKFGYYYHNVFFELHKSVVKI